MASPVTKRSRGGRYPCGVKLGFVLVMVTIGTAVATGLIIPLTGPDQAPPRSNSTAPSTPPIERGVPPSFASAPPTTPIVTVSDIGPELDGQYRSHTVFGRELDGQLAVTFMPALPRDDRTVHAGAEYVVRRFLKVDIVYPQWRTVSPYLRLTTGSSTFDVRLIKNHDGTVRSMVIAKRVR